MTARPASRFLLHLVLALALASSPAGQQPTFRTGVELVRLDVTVVNATGEPVTGLTPSDFEVTVKGEPRPVVSAQFLSSVDETASTAEGQRLEAGSFSSNLGQTGRLIVVIVDELSLANTVGTEKVLFEGLAEFVGSLRPNDRIALASIPGTSARVDFTNDFGRVQEAVGRLRTFPARSASDSPRPSIQLDRGEGMTTTPGAFPATRDALRQDYETMVDTLCAVAGYLKPVEGPKTLVLVTGQLPGGFGQVAVSQWFAKCAAEARVKLYAIRHRTVNADAQSSPGSNEGAEDPLSALHQLAGLSGGAVFDGIARATGVFERISRESSASYVLGFDPPEGMPRDKPMEVKVRVKRSGLLVRSRTQVLLPGASSPGKDPAKAVRDALQQPGAATGIGIRVASYAVRAAGASELKTVVTAELPTLYVGDTAAWGWEIRDGAKPVTNAFDQVAFSSAPAVLTAAVNLAPGRYTMRLAVATPDGRLGSVEHPLLVEAHGTPVAGVSDLFVGESANGRFQPRVTIGRAAEEVVAFVEVYPAANGGEDLQVEFEVEGPEGPTGAGVPGAASGGGARRMVQATLPLEDLGPGRYTVTATVTAGGRSVATVRRAFLLDR
jgi:VWFA-related protein